MMNVNSNPLKHGSQKVQMHVTSDNNAGASTVTSSIDTDISDLLKDTFDPTANKCNTMLKTVALYNALELTADKSLLSRDGEIDRSLSEILDDLQKAVQADDVTNNNVSNLSFSDNQGSTYKDTSKDVNDQSKSLIEIQEEHQFEKEIERIERLRNPRFQTLPAYKKRAKQEAQWKAAIRAARRAQIDKNKNLGFGVQLDYFKMEEEQLRNQLTFGHKPILPKPEFPILRPAETLDLTCLDLPSTKAETNTSSDDDCVIIEPETESDFQKPVTSCNIPRPAKTNLMINTKKHLSSANHFPANSRIFNRSLQELQSTADAISYNYLNSVTDSSINSIHSSQSISKKPRLNFGIQNSQEVIDVDEDEVNLNFSNLKPQRTTMIPIKRKVKRSSIDFIDSDETEFCFNACNDEFNSTIISDMTTNETDGNPQSTAITNYKYHQPASNSMSTSFSSFNEKFSVSIPVPPEHDYTINCSNLSENNDMGNLDSFSTSPLGNLIKSPPLVPSDHDDPKSQFPISFSGGRHIPVPQLPNSTYKSIDSQNGPARSSSFTHRRNGHVSLSQRQMFNDNGRVVLNLIKSHDMEAVSGKQILNNNTTLSRRNNFVYMASKSQSIHKKQKSCSNCLKLAKYLPFISYSRRKETGTNVSYGYVNVMLLCEVCGLFVRETVISGDKMKLDHVSASCFPTFLSNTQVNDSNDPSSQNFIWLPKP